ncbi:MAG TPA: chromosome segregation protein SMC [Desulfitobacteriaceae bacterium]|nr:chromosome segregation protein SMC [Desulfitobacteriaceae bacterium]
MAEANNLPVFLKSIIIQGFKSFADRVRLELGPGLNIVVGPNGSGKSNVADAVRWVLGEQSVRSLRGSKMEDFIFTGTLQRRPVGMAEVSLVFDNITGIFPLEFQEVTITRRLYRNGEGQFFINRVPCRLRDIQELFMDTGAGKEGFSIIGQGRVDEVLNSRTEERRFIIEEAAGITKFRVRKKEALKRLDDSEHNLERVEDILREIDTGLSPLAAQAKIAEQSLALEAEKRRLEIQLAVRDLAEVQKKLAVGLEDANELKSGLAQVVSELAAAENNCLHHKVALNHCEQNLQEQENKVQLSQQTVNSLTQELGLRRERRNYLEERSAELVQEISAEDRRLTALSARLKDLADKQAVLESRLAEAAGKLAEDEQRLKLARMANESKQLEGLKTELFEILTQKANCSNEINNFGQTIANLNNQGISLEQECRQTAQELEANSRLLARQSLELTALRQQARARQEQEAALRSKHEQTEKLLQENSSNFRVLSRKADLAGARWQALRTLEDSREGYQRGVKEIMLAKKQGIPACTPLYGTVAELLEVEEELELALEVSLGGSLQNIIARTMAEANEAIAFLKAGRLGRATFLPLDVIQPNRQHMPAEISADPGFVGIALDLVRFDNIFRPALEFLLGKIIIVKDMPAAARAAAVTHHRMRIVTLEGDQVHPGGSLTGGSYQRRGENLLGRSREIGRLRQELDLLELQLQDLKVTGAALAADKQELSEELARVGQEKKELREKLLHCKISTENLEKESKRRQKEAALSDLRYREVVSERAEMEGKLKISSARLEIIEQKIRTARSELAKQEHELKESALAIEAQSERLTSSKIQAAKWEQEYELSSAILLQEKFAWQEKEKVIEHKKTEYNKAQADCARLDGEIEILLKNLEEKTGLQEENLLAAALLRQERENLTLALNDWEQIAQRQRPATKALEQKIHVLELGLARWQAEWETGTRHLWEEYSLSWQETSAYLPLSDKHLLRPKIQEIKKQLEDLGPVNQAAIEEYPKMLQRRDFLSSQHQDLAEANQSLRELIAELDKTMSLRFREGFKAVNESFQEVFRELFVGGQAELRLVEPDDLLNSGVEIIAQPPWKKPQTLSLLSGGERALTAIALLFALLRVKPSPFCILDEIEASLDDTNIQRFASYLRRLADLTQFVIISHRKGTMETADVLYGITMEESGVSRLLSVRLDDEA